MFLNVQFLEAVGLIFGMIIGSGIFVLPYAVSVSGIVWGLITAFLAFLGILGVHLAYGEIVLNSDGLHRLPGYAKKYLGKFFGVFATLSQILGFNTVLLIFGGLGGIFLNILFGGNPFIWSLAFFGVASLLLLFENIEGIGFIDFILTMPLIAIIIFISFLSYNGGSFQNINLFGTDRFFSFGVFVFALAGLAAIADARDIFRKKDAADSGRLLKLAIIYGTAVSFVLYLMFSLGVIMASDGQVTKNAMSGLSGILGQNIVKIGALLGLLSIFRSYLALGYNLNAMYKLDLRLLPAIAWVASLSIPIVLFLAGAKDFLKLISIMGGTFVAFDGIMVVYILRRMRNIGLAKNRLLSFGKIQQYFLIAVFSLGIIYELIYQIF
ncbi:hypothetical protein A2W54_00050 [Candidatus Giovannonibacteria bacterium RIFCSPHIGHO2_02_43_13]|uniref:Amino acid transporter transmembrane domain-containing protein n=1 Tax=Candidatus Giovannonibacteria bacterium RIFCSPHIGHO2_02_43_13 TaxID=1798330 RepID=A0A1F5WT48_9BACT|nr:MAG: Aromatic amino acid permease [Parcubacteria group bacterium GW2011_GWA2_44_13]OGF72918.1 MAG: hypothetical protein A3E06_03650 [Candidatus Giovannonibacteria bacterium RIFCSPHIGHO2_12_FULL_44_42]OGF78810.1 MAG: hypothetical protein A2W54_00050 [Candidatus Giovannonibacteria bacterium RIFCSPHIGHO2_02_43_13]OGF89169.1 MAG: hypothetical protein A3I94_00250 [Candidatus Giovannonibacteria bacterium RIFCSPLOWO2_02_FULL_43_54]OGF97228.1 MAG: hypothetical protein A3H08_02265 [Candidatus Giovann